MSDPLCLQGRRRHRGTRCATRFACRRVRHAEAATPAAARAERSAGPGSSLPGIRVARERLAGNVRPAPALTAIVELCPSPRLHRAGRLRRRRSHSPGSPRPAALGQSIPTAARVGFSALGPGPLGAACESGRRRPGGNRVPRADKPKGGPPPSQPASSPAGHVIKVT